MKENRCWYRKRRPCALSRGYCHAFEATKDFEKTMDNISGYQRSR